jgi:hypothetical protein
MQHYVDEPWDGNGSCTCPTSKWAERARTSLTRVRERSGLTKKISRAQQETRMKKRKTKRTEKGHRWTICLFAMLWLCFAGYCFASAPQGHPGYFEGNGIGEVSNSTLVAFQTYCCPTGTQGSRSRSVMAGSSHAGCWMAEQLLQQRFCIAQQTWEFHFGRILICLP